MRSKSDNVELARRSAVDGGAPATPEATRSSENEEWAWMVDEDPAFYLSTSARMENAGG